MKTRRVVAVVLPLMLTGALVAFGGPAQADDEVVEPAPAAVEQASEPEPEAVVEPPVDNLAKDKPKNQTEDEVVEETTPPVDKKVTICHVPPGNPGNAHYIEVAKKSILNGSSHHASDPADVIPAFEGYPGKNLDQANPCEGPGPEPDAIVTHGTEDAITCTEYSVREWTTIVGWELVDNEWVQQEPHTAYSEWVGSAPTEEQLAGLDCDTTEDPEHVTAGPVTFADPTCENNTRPQFDAPEQEGIVWWVDDSYDGDDNLTITVTAEPLEGYTIDGQTVWSHTYGPFIDEDVCNPEDDEDDGESDDDTTDSPTKVVTVAGVLPDTGAPTVTYVLAGIAFIAGGIALVTRRKA